MSSFPTLRPVNIPYSNVKDRSADLSESIERGFGPYGLVIITVSDVPGYNLLRQNIPCLAPSLAGLPEETKKELEDPGSRYIWVQLQMESWAGELESGKPGSYYANPLLDVPTMEEQLIMRYSSYRGSHIWPKKALPELELGDEVAEGVDHSTFALFIEPHWDEKLNIPENVQIHKELISSMSPTFGEYSELLLDKYYHRRRKQ